MGQGNAASPFPSFSGSGGSPFASQQTNVMGPASFGAPPLGQQPMQQFTEQGASPFPMSLSGGAPLPQQLGQSNIKPSFLSDGGAGNFLGQGVGSIRQGDAASPPSFSNLGGNLVGQGNAAPLFPNSGQTASPPFAFGRE